MDNTTRTTVKVLAITVAFIGLLWLAFSARQVLVWFGIAAFLAIAINPAVELFRSYLPGHRRSAAIGLVFLIGVFIMTFLLITLIPPVADQIQSFARNVPHYIDQVTNGNNAIARLVRQYHLTDEIKHRQAEVVSRATSASGVLINLLATLFADFAAGITILVLTIFMLLEGPRWIQFLWRLHPAATREHNRDLVHRMYHAVTGYVAGNLFTSFLAAFVTSIMLLILGVPYAISLGILVGLIDLIPLVGATIGAMVVVTVALFTSKVAAIVMLIFYIVYQQVENHALQPIVYGRTVQMSPLLVLMAVLVGASIGGMVGALVAIPIAASLQIIFRDHLAPKIISK